MTRRTVLGCAALLAVAAVLAYANSLHGPFVFDDTTTIRDNLAIRQLWPLWHVLLPPPGLGLTSSGRPLVNLTLAINYAISGNGVVSYHVGNLILHVLVSWTLFGLLRRTFAKLSLPEGAAFAAALLWTVHPLGTEAVSYIVQRAESLMALCYLLALDGFARKRYLLSFLACLAGMACKEVMVSAPLIVLLYDRTFDSGTFAAAWRRHRVYYCGLAATWILLAGEVALTGNRGGTAGYCAHVSPVAYALAQFPAIARYLRLVFWPTHLVFDYGTQLIASPAQIIPSACLILVLVAGTIDANLRPTLRPLGFAGAAFFAILAPSSSILPIATQVMAEHRMYLPSAFLLAALIGAIATMASSPSLRWTLIGAVAFVAVGLVAATRARNDDYRSVEALWRSAAANYPSNPRAHCNLGYELGQQGRQREAIQEFLTTLRIDPEYGDAENNLGGAYFQLGDIPTSIVHFEAALRINPNLAAAHYNLGGALVRSNEIAAGLREFHSSLSLDPSSPEAHYNYATSLVQLHRFPEAIAEYREALRIRPDYAEARNNLATALLQAGHVGDALAEYHLALRLDPHSATAHFNLANLLIETNRADDAISEYHTALALEPTYAKAHCNLGSAYVRTGNLQAAVAEYRTALGLNPQLAEARNNLDRVEAYLRHPQ